MPKVCSQHGCPEIAVRRGRCPEHVRADERRLMERRPTRGGYNTTRWRRVRRLALERDDHRCVECSSTNRLHVDHIDGQGLEGPRGYDLANLRTLCISCHSRTTALATRFGRD